MFTGLIEAIGLVRSSSRAGDSLKIAIEAEFPGNENGVALGDSVAVNGACLTASSLFPGGFAADVMGVTSRKTLLASLVKGQRVNLERALALGSRLGGHLVTGHVDGTGRISRARRDGIARILTFRCEESIARYVVRTGSIAVDGVSLTVCDAGAREFSVSLVPHTAERTTLGKLRVGDEANLECDILAKYAERRAGHALSSIQSELARFGLT